MATNTDYKTFYIRKKDDPKFIINKIVEDDLVNIIIQKLTILLFSNKGDLYGDDSFGMDIPRQLWQLRVSKNELEDNIRDNISTYIRELNDIGYTISLNIFKGEIHDIMEIGFTIKDYEIFTYFN